MAMHRIEVHPTQGNVDPRGEDALQKAHAAGVETLPRQIETTAVYLIEGDLDDLSITLLSNELLCDAVTETSSRGNISTPRSICY